MYTLQTLNYMKNLSDYLGQNIDGKSIVISGGTTEIGKATAELLVSLGDIIFIFGRDTDNFNNAINSIKNSGQRSSL